MISLELRNTLTRAAHARYLKGNNFFKVSIDHVDQRLCADIAAFSSETSRLYGHSFKPCLEFVLSLSEAARELGYARPFALFGSQVVVTALLRSLTPPLGRMIAKVPSFRLL